MSRYSRLQRKSWMSFNRFEALSDGVFAIAITLLALEIRIKNLTNATSKQAWDALLNLFPHIKSKLNPESFVEKI